MRTIVRVLTFIEREGHRLPMTFDTQAREPSPGVLAESRDRHDDRDEREPSPGVLVESLAIGTTIETGLNRSLAIMAPWRQIRKWRL